MNISRNIKKMWAARDELSPRNLRAQALPAFFALPLAIIVGDLRFLDQGLAVAGVDANNLIMMVFGLGFLPVLFVRERHMTVMLRVSALAQAALLPLQLALPPGLPRFYAYLAFHAVNGMCTVSGFYLFAFALNNVERLFIMIAAQVYYALGYVCAGFGIGPWYDAAALLCAGSLVATAFFVRPPQRTARGLPGPGARESGVVAIIALNAIYYAITLMTMYIQYNQQVVEALPFGIGGLICVVVTFVVMLAFNLSALHLWSLCLVLSVAGVGALAYSHPLAIGTGSFLYGIGEGLGFIVVYYLQGGALKRCGAFRLLRLWCACACGNYVIIGGLVYALFNGIAAAHQNLAFTIMLVPALACLLFAPVLHDRLFRADWTDGYHMADMPSYADALCAAQSVDSERALGLTPREMEVFTMLLTEAAPKQIASTLRISYATINFHSKNLYRKLGVQSRTELFARYGIGGNRGGREAIL